MRTTADIPDPIYRELESRAAHEGKWVEERMVRCVAVSWNRATEALPPEGPVQPQVQESENSAAVSEEGSATAPRPRKLKLPLIQSNRPGSLRLGEEGVYEYIPFP